MKRALPALLLALPLVLAGCAVPDEPTAVQPPESGQAAKASPTVLPVKMTAKKTAFRKAEFGTGGPYTCAKVVITNQTKTNLDVNPYFFEITGTDGEKRKAAVGAAAHEFDSLTLAPKEKASGTVCAETSVPPKVVTFTDGLSEAARAEVG